jgi:hypothetical protein
MNTLRLALACLAGGCLAGITDAAPSESEAALRACGHGQEREIEGPRARKPSIAVVSVRPEESSYVTEKSMVTAELEYDIDRFEPGMYQVNVQFETVDARATTSGFLIEFPELQFAHGVLRFCAPLRGLWRLPEVKWPLGMVFHLTVRNDDGSTSVVASTDVTRFNVANLPATALNRAAPDAEQTALRDAVDKLWPFLEFTRVHVQACAETFPELKSSLLPPLADWRKRHAIVQEKSDVLYADLSRQRHPGMGKEGFLIMLEAARSAMLRSLRDTPEALSRRNCELMPGRLNGENYDPAKRHSEAYERVKNSSMR